MKKIYAITVVTFCSSLFTICNAQTWDSLGAGTNQYVYALGVYNNTLYIGGYFETAGNKAASKVASWNGNSWDSLQGGIDSDHAIYVSVDCIAEYSDSLVAGGSFLVVNRTINTYDITQWNGITWDTLRKGLNGDVYALTIYNGNLYAGGDFSGINPYSGIYSIAQWNGITWDSVSTISEPPFPYGTVYALAVYNGNLYAGGSFQLAGHKKAYNIAQWNGSSWDTVGRGININGIVYALAVYNGNLYAGGYFDSAGGVYVHNMAQWNGIAWSAVGAGADTTVYALNVYSSSLIAGGAFTTAGGNPANHIASWNGTSWDSLGAGTNGTVRALCSYLGDLYVGGLFSKAGNVNANNVARWCPGGCSMGISTIKNENDFNVYPNPSNGVFTLGVRDKEQGISEMQVYNVLGEKVYSQFNLHLASVKTTFNIDLSNQPSGMYFYRVIDNNGVLIGEGKLILQH